MTRLMSWLSFFDKIRSTDEDLYGVAKEGDKSVEALEGVATELGEGLTGAFHRLGRFFGSAFGEELVGIADDFLFQTLRQEVPWWVNRQMLRDNLGSGDARARVPFTHSPMTEQTHAVEHTPSQDAVQDVRFGAVAVDTRRVGAAHTDVVQHRGLLNKLDVDGRTVVNEALAQLHSQVGHLTAMRN